MVKKKDEIGVIEIFDDAKAFHWKGICTKDARKLFDGLGKYVKLHKYEDRYKAHFAFFDIELNYKHIYIAKDEWLIEYGPKQFDVLTPKEYKEWKNKRIMIQRFPVMG